MKLSSLTSLAFETNAVADSLLSSVVPLTKEDLSSVVPPMKEDLSSVVPPMKEDLSSVVPLTKEGLSSVVPLTKEDLSSVVPLTKEDGFNLSFAEIHHAAEAGVLVEFLADRFADRADFSLLLANKDELTDVNCSLTDAAAALDGREPRKTGVSRSGLCLVMAVILEAIQQQFISFPPPPPTPPATPSTPYNQ